MALPSAFRLVTLGLLMGALMLGGVLGAAASARSESPIGSGSLLRGQTFPAVYYVGADGMRYVFPNDKTYFTWYETFNDVVWISDEELGKIQIGGNVTYKPAVKMAKITSDPKTYAIGKNGELRHVTSEDIAYSLYGAHWNTAIDDIPDGFFSNYTIGEPIMSTSDYSVTNEAAAATTINNDKDIAVYETLRITDSGFSDRTLTVAINGTVRFVNDGSTPHAAVGDDGSWGTGSISPGESYTVRFTDEGVYDFSDYYNEDATGTIEVEE